MIEEIGTKLYHQTGEQEFRSTIARLEKGGLTQQALADRIGLHISQLRRYEGGTSQPTLDVLKNLAVALSVSTDSLVFDQDGRVLDDRLRLQFVANRPPRRRRKGHHPKRHRGHPAEARDPTLGGSLERVHLRVAL